MSAVRTNPPREGLATLYSPIEADLVEVDRILREQLRSQVSFIDELTARVRLYQGKRIRPALLLLTAHACGKVHREHYVLGAVIEMIHAATLVHDDLLDEADTRRHVTTVHAEWGTEAGVLLGDYLFSQAYYLAATLDTVEGCRIIGQATNQTCEGELLQISRRGYFELTTDEYIRIVAGKTAELISCGCLLGAKFAGSEPEVTQALASYGRNLGIAFQIADDILDLIGEPTSTGKSIGTDWVKRKMTLPLIRLRESSTPEQVDKLRQLFEDSTDRRRELLTWLKSTDAINFSQSIAEQYAEAAASQLECLPPSTARDRLHQIAKFAARRAF